MGAWGTMGTGGGEVSGKPGPAGRETGQVGSHSYSCPYCTIVYRGIVVRRSVMYRCVLVEGWKAGPRAGVAGDAISTRTQHFLAPIDSPHHNDAPDRFCDVQTPRDAEMSMR